MMQVERGLFLTPNHYQKNDNEYVDEDEDEDENEIEENEEEGEAAAAPLAVPGGAAAPLAAKGVGKKLGARGWTPSENKNSS